MAIFTAIATFFTGVAASIGFGAAAATAIGAAAANLIKSAVFSLLSRALTPKPSIPKQEIQATINQASGPRTRVYGQALLGGTRSFWETDANKLHQIILLNHTAVTANIAFWIDGRQVATDAYGGVTSEPFTVKSSGVVWPNLSPQYKADIVLDWHDGTGDGGDWPDVTAIFPALWTADHKLTGQATICAKMTAPSGAKFSKRFPRGPNTNIQMEVQGAAVLDTRTGVTAYSDNAALCIADYLTHSDGYRISSDKIDTETFNVFADLADEAVPLKAGGTELRYRLWGLYSLQDDPKSVLARMVLTCDASIYQTADGKVGILGGQYSEPDVTITDDDIYSLEKVEGDSALDGFNVIKGTYTSADHDYQDVEAQAWENTEALLAQPEKSEDMQADMIPSHGQMRRMMKLQLHSRNRKWTGQIVTNLVGLKARFPKGDGVHSIRVQYAELGMDEVVEVLGHAITAEKAANGAIIWKCTIDIAQISPDWFAWDAATEEGTAPDEPERAAVEGTPDPTISSLTQEAGPVAVLTVTDISRPDLELDVEIKPDSATDWASMPEAGLRAESSVLALGDYNVRARFKGGDWATTLNITII